MKLSSLVARDSFALLGPGFGDGRCLLLAELSSTVGTSPQLVYQPFEGEQAQTWGTRRWQAVELERDVPPQAFALELAQPHYARTVTVIREAIAAGDVYQVCYTLRVPLGPTSGAQLFATLNAHRLARFAAWVRLPSGVEFVSASPELFFEIDGARVHSEPMKGTARHDAGGLLETSEKDRSELAMITDLVRNDLTPICRPRSVQVTCARRVIELPYALQTVSDVVGELLPRTNALDVLSALHPGGSVTGAPKHAALGMIGKLEQGPRGAYCGALGLWQGPRATFALLIRTASKTPAGWTYGVGSGIVYDSVAEQELDELDTKLGALRCATRCSE